MKLWSILFVCTILVNPTFAQNTLDGRFKLQQVVFKGQEFFDRSKEPKNEEDKRITVIFATADEQFNEQMNQRPYDFFKKSEITFLKDSVYVRVGTSATNGTYQNEFHYGFFSVIPDTNLITFSIAGNPPKVNQFIYELRDSLLILTSMNHQLVATYQWHPYKIDDPYNQPWKNYNVPIIIDAYHLNDIEWDELLIDPKVTAVIHKAGEGTMADTKYSVRKSAAKNRNLLWGSYFLGTDDNPEKQAELYYSITGNDSTELHCLDLEDVNAKGRMSLKQAEKFIKCWFELTGKYPVLYCNKDVLSQINKKYGPKSVFAKCPLWYARFRKDIPDWESSTWDTYTFWQFSSEINCEQTGECLYNVPGVNYDMDVNVYNGTIFELRIFWPNLD
ncbi:MAG: glycoside hydrolase family 25 protein [Crocinitomicaceae bacterium]|nr:glycoside hydrolase family 25 protein [Crocinitomicaceae bacterium]